MNYAEIRKKINKLLELYKIKKIAYDPWSASQMAIQLSDHDGIDMIEFRQGFKSFS